MVPCCCCCQFASSQARAARPRYRGRPVTDLPAPMNAVLLLAPGLALALLGAHFYRAGQWPLVLACAVLVALLAWPRAWAARLVQVALAAGAVEWLWTALALVQQRQALGQPWQRLALILGAVALLTLAAALVFRHPRLRRRFARG